MGQWTVLCFIINQFKNEKFKFKISPITQAFSFPILAQIESTKSCTITNAESIVGFEHHLTGTF